MSKAFRVQIGLDTGNPTISFSHEALMDEDTLQELVSLLTWAEGLVRAKCMCADCARKRSTPVGQEVST